MSIRSPQPEERGMAVTCDVLAATPVLSSLMLLVEEVRENRSEVEPGKKKVGKRWV